ncbi:MAG: hypothetical protein PHY12_11260 [Eubacteriales bacterium]|nr:hypothetical protein [Eubacteriales bacterium]
MNTAEFDRAMRALASTEASEASKERLRRALAALPDAPRAKAPRLRLAPALLALLLVSGVAVAARLGLLAFWQQNPYNFFHDRQGVRPELRLSPFVVTDASGLQRLRLEPLDSAWIEGRLTLTVRLSADAALAAGEREGDGVRLCAPVGEEAQWAPLAEVGLLLYPEDTACAVDGWTAWAEHAECSMADDGVTLALQFPPDFVTASDLPALLDAQGRLPLRLELNVYDPAADAFAVESVRIAVAAPTEEERMEMDP